MPTQNRYRELTSTSNCTEYQARRLNIRERMEDGGTRPVSTLNGTLATTRWLVAIMENHQQKDGSIEIPKAMRAYMGGKEVIEPTKWEADFIIRPAGRLAACKAYGGVRLCPLPKSFPFV